MNSDATLSTTILSEMVFDSLPDSVRSYIRFLEATIQQQQATIQQQQATIQQQQLQIHQQQMKIQQLETRVHELEARLSKNSSNSSKPPGSDGLKKKTKSQRGKSNKKPGGQQGRIGKGLAQVQNPDVIVIHSPTNCNGCGSSLNEVGGLLVEKRQVFEIPQPTIEVTEHHALQKKCPCCGEVTRASFPENIRGPVQYGHRVRALIAYFTHQHFIPVDRVCEIFEDIFGVALSPGTCANVDERLFEKLESFETNLKMHLLATRVLHFDETGMRCEKKLHWVHVASSDMATLYTIHAKRGQEAMEAAGILPQYQGIAIHDHWFPYFSFQQLTHGLCNAHHLRELTFIYEQEKEEWAKRMFDFLIETKNEVEKHSAQGVLSPETLLQIEQGYQRIITEGLAYHATLPPLPKKKRGKQKQRDGKNLLDRLNERRDCVLRFAHNFSVLFTNNQGERDIRMVKLKQKIAGCFRAFSGGQIFCRIRSYISTARKQGWSIWDALADAIRGSPHMLVNDQSAIMQLGIA